MGFTHCSGECCVCGCASLCLAGNGDDDFFPAETDEIIERLDKEMYPKYRNYMIEELRIRGVVYNGKS